MFAFRAMSRSWRTAMALNKRRVLPSAFGGERRVPGGANGSAWRILFLRFEAIRAG